jgi:ABC-type sugar transport system substrate-binding protein
MPEMRRIALFLVRQDEAQRAWAADAESEASHYGIEVKEYWSDNSAQTQVLQISECVFQDLASALIIMPASSGGPAALIAQAVARNKSVVLLNRVASDTNTDILEPAAAQTRIFDGACRSRGPG